MQPQSQKQLIRRDMRAKRRQLTRKQQNLAARELARQASACRLILSAKKVLSYQAFAGEISTHVLTKSIKPSDLYLPRITHYERCLMRFYSSLKLDSHNRYGILEPSAMGEPIKANRFDLILLPLVAFDRNGARVGMGSGYYDRALASLAHQASTRPKLVGLAHHFQEINNLSPEPWDIPLDAILTDREFINIDV